MHFQWILQYLFLATFAIQTSFAVLCLRAFRNCSCSLDSQFVSSPASQQAISRGILMLSLQYDYLLTKSMGKDSNILFAPINIMKTIATVMLGTAGETERELSPILGMGVGRKLAYSRNDELHREFGYLLNQITNEIPGVVFGANLNIAGGVFIQKGIPICGSYLKMAKNIYKTDLISVDFKKDGTAAANTINRWIADKTKNRITNLVEPPIPSITKIVVAGALFFNGDWETPFMASATRWQPFYLGSEGRYSKESVQVQMMVNHGNVPYYEDPVNGFEAIGLPYKKREVMMFIVLPKLYLSLKSLLSNLQWNNIETLVEKSISTPTEVSYVIPKMKLSSRVDLRSAMESLGVRTLFDSGKANFSNLADDIYVDKILHQVELEVDEIGTTGAAATAVLVNRGGYINFRVDRPFLFFIFNVKAGVLTFWGSINKPTPFQ